MKIVAALMSFTVGVELKYLQLQVIKKFPEIMITKLLLMIRKKWMKLTIYYLSKVL